MVEKRRKLECGKKRDRGRDGRYRDKGTELLRQM